MAQLESIAEQTIVEAEEAAHKTELPPTPAFNPTQVESTIRPFVYRAPRDPKAPPVPSDRRSSDSILRRR